MDKNFIFVVLYCFFDAARENFTIQDETIEINWKVRQKLAVSCLTLKVFVRMILIIHFF